MGGCARRRPSPACATPQAGRAAAQLQPAAPGGPGEACGKSLRTRVQKPSVMPYVAIKAGLCACSWGMPTRMPLPGLSLRLAPAPSPTSCSAADAAAGAPAIRGGGTPGPRPGRHRRHHLPPGGGRLPQASSGGGAGPARLAQEAGAFVGGVPCGRAQPCLYPAWPCKELCMAPLASACPMQLQHRTLHESAGLGSAHLLLTPNASWNPPLLLHPPPCRWASSWTRGGWRSGQSGRHWRTCGARRRRWPASPRCRLRCGCPARGRWPRGCWGCGWAAGSSFDPQKSAPLSSLHSMFVLLSCNISKAGSTPMSEFAKIPPIHSGIAGICTYKPDTGQGGALRPPSILATPGAPGSCASKKARCRSLLLPSPGLAALPPADWPAPVGPMLLPCSTSGASAYPAHSAPPAAPSAPASASMECSPALPLPPLPPPSTSASSRLREQHAAPHGLSQPFCPKSIETMIGAAYAMQGGTACNLAPRRAASICLSAGLPGARIQAQPHLSSEMIP